MRSRYRSLLNKAAAGLALVAVGLLAYVGYLVLTVPPVEAPDESGPPQPERQAADEPRLSPDDLAVTWERFDPPPEPGPREEDDEETVPAGTEEPDQEGPGIPFKLRGIVHSSAGNSIAFLEFDDRIVLRLEGETVAGWTVVSISRDAIAVSRGEEEQKLALAPRGFDGGQTARRLAAGQERDRESAERSAAPSPRSRPERVTASAGGATRGGGRTPDADAQQARASALPPLHGADARVVVSRSLVETVRRDPESLEYGVRYRAETDAEGNVRGFRVEDVEPGSLASRYGLAPGDLILAVNGQPIDSPRTAMSLYNRYRLSDQVQVRLRRDGQVREVLYYAR